MTALTTRYAALLCVLLLLQECGHVHMVKYHKQSKGVQEKGHDDVKTTDKECKDKSSSESSNPKENDWVWLDADTTRLVPQKPLYAKSTRRGWISSVFKAIRIGGKVASTVTSLAGLGNAIFQAIAGCCTSFPDACRFRDEFLELKTEIQEKSQRADEIELEAKNIQVYINHNINAFEKILDELNEIHDEQETFLTSISPEVSIAINNQTAIIKKLIKEKSNLGSAVNFTTISSLYESAVDSALAIGFPLVGFVIPAAKKIYGFAKRRMAASSTAQVEVKTSTKLVDPPSKSRLGRYISGGVKQYQAKVTSIKLRLNQRFGRAAKIGKGIISGAKVAMSYFNAGLNIYMIIASHEACRAKQEEARKARDDLKQSLVHFEETERNLTIAKNVMEQSFQYLRGNITHESTLSVIADIKEMVEDMSGTSEDLVEVAVDIQHFLDNIKEDTSYKGTNRLEEQILTALKRIPFTLSCYTNKVKMLKYILNSCKKGKGSFDFLYDEARGYFDNDDEDNPDSPQNCARWTGYRYVNKEDLLKVWRDEAKKHNVKENCVLNDPAKKDTACSFKKDGYEAAEIGEKMKLTEAEVQGLIENCPAISQLTPAEEIQVCNLQKYELTNDNIAASLALEVALVADVEC